MHYTTSRTWCNRKTAILQAMLLPWYCQNNVSMYFQQWPVSEIYLILSYLAWQLFTLWNTSWEERNWPVLVILLLLSELSLDSSLVMQKSKDITEDLANFNQFWTESCPFDQFERCRKRWGDAVEAKWDWCSLNNCISPQMGRLSSSYLAAPQPDYL